MGSRPDLEALMQAPTTSSTDQLVRVNTLIAVALVASVLAYMAIAWFVAPTTVESSGDAEFIQLMATILAVLSLGHLVAAQMLFAIRARAAAKLPMPEQRLGAFRIAFILSFALREAVAVYGLILSLLSGDARWCLGFGAVALISMLLGWPKRSAMNRLAAEVPPIG
jgi:hypothetical protein